MHSCYLIAEKFSNLSNDLKKERVGMKQRFRGKGKCFEFVAHRPTVSNVKGSLFIDGMPFKDSTQGFFLVSCQ